MVLLSISETGGLGTLELEVPDGAGGITAASRLCLEGVGKNRDLLSGTGLDWGSGSGCLAIAAARISAVERVIGIDVAADAVATATRNATRNGVADRVTFLEADLFTAAGDRGRELLSALEGRAGFLMANPPASDGDDGLGWRRAVLDEAKRFLVDGAPVLLQVSYQYGRRIRRLATDVPGFEYRRVVATTDWIPFDQTRADLARSLQDYAEEEARGGLPYAFRNPDDGRQLTATEALSRVIATGLSPMSRWQLHLLRWHR
jgi:SAM-dependent methyltransferase